MSLKWTQFYLTRYSDVTFKKSGPFLGRGERAEFWRNVRCVENAGSWMCGEYVSRSGLLDVPSDRGRATASVHSARGRERGRHFVFFSISSSVCLCMQGALTIQEFYHCFFFTWLVALSFNYFLPNRFLKHEFQSLIFYLFWDFLMHWNYAYWFANRRGQRIQVSFFQLIRLNNFIKNCDSNLSQCRPWILSW